MNRKIKFRCWTGDRMINVGDNDTALWVDGNAWVLLSHFMGGGSALKPVIQKPNKKPVNSENPDCALMQYTGLKDKNGVEIYEGDLLKCHDHPTGVEDGVYEVKFARSSFYANLLLSDWGSSWIEIIGNIYEFPELITPKIDTDGK